MNSHTHAGSSLIRSLSRVLGAAVVTALPLLVGCSAGLAEDLGSSDDALVDPATSAGETTLSPTASGKPLLETEEVELLDALRAHRTSLGHLPPLRVSIGLTRAAKAHAADMAANDFLGHDSGNDFGRDRFTIDRSFHPAGARPAATVSREV